MYGELYKHKVVVVVLDLIRNCARACFVSSWESVWWFLLV